MMSKISKSIRAKGTLIAIGILFFSCFVSTAITTILYLVSFDKNMNIRESHEIFSSLMFLSFFLCMALGSTLLYTAMRKITGPIIRISEAAKAVSKGNFSIKVMQQSDDEIGTLAKNFNMMTQELNNMEYLRKDFISNVSHEFKTPIASIQGFAELLQDKNLSDENFQTYTNIIIEETKRLSHLSSNMLRLTKLDHQLIPESVKPFSLDEQIRKTIVLLEEKWSRKNLVLNIDLDSITFTGDEALIQQIWLNLIENAIKFSTEMGQIFIKAKKFPSHIYVEIKDQGIGISKQNQVRIYEKFFQADKSHSKEGSGLGLAIVKKIVEICGGDIKFISELGRGTTFEVNLPVHNE
ncbi:HAMP domain-containing sensor histidine kinase [Neobacillus sp. WH10]|uniref:HAMP domain-containing sensor histidine kinase n=1 Tax=Neobacillus sp. WH10 TaxID=3047873 RepID=UPI0024C13CF5|nr:HAMP domain-containing sensor histidine kinase [Neobacillus sp. WH10]WHY77600.1 HAMP domain-containing sensor histidine kinase [Neobacillus sp. WH10]